MDSENGFIFPSQFWNYDVGAGVPSSFQTNLHNRQIVIRDNTCGGNWGADSMAALTKWTMENAPSSDREWFVVGSTDGTQLWDLETFNQQMLLSPPPHAWTWDEIWHFDEMHVNPQEISVETVEIDDPPPEDPFTDIASGDSFALDPGYHLDFWGELSFRVPDGWSIASWQTQQVYQQGCAVLMCYLSNPQKVLGLYVNNVLMNVAGLTGLLKEPSGYYLEANALAIDMRSNVKFDQKNQIQGSDALSLGWWRIFAAQQYSYYRKVGYGKLDNLLIQQGKLWYRVDGTWYANGGRARPIPIRFG